MQAVDAVNNWKLIQATESSARDSSLTAAGNNGAVDGQSSSAGQALSSLGNNYTAFLTMLTTQLKNQDPSKPMSTDSFTSELALMAGVEQQVEANKKLSSLISLNESSQLTNASKLVGRKAVFRSSILPLQNGRASLDFKGMGKPIAISISNSSGVVVKNVVDTSKNGDNHWEWDGNDNSGNKLSDGAYGVSVKSLDEAGNISDLSFTVNGIISGLKKGNSEIQVEFGKASVPMSKIVNVSTV